MISLNKVSNTDTTLLPSITPELASMASKISLTQVTPREKSKIKLEARSYVNLNEETAKALKHEKKLKIFSLCFLAMQISLIAAAALVILFVATPMPFLIILGIGSIINAGFPTKIMHKEIGFPLISEIFFVIYQFTKKPSIPNRDKILKAGSQLSQDFKIIKNHAQAIELKLRADLQAEAGKPAPNPRTLSNLAESLQYLTQIVAL